MLDDMELQALVQRRTISESDAGWLCCEQRRELAAATDDEQCVSLAGLDLFGATSDSEDGDRFGGDAEGLLVETWSHEATLFHTPDHVEVSPSVSRVQLSVKYCLAVNDAFGHGDEIWMASIAIARRLCCAERRLQLLGSLIQVHGPDGTTQQRMAMEGLKVLEVGAGAGIPAAVCFRLGAKVVASDYPKLGSIRALVRSAVTNSLGTDDSKDDGLAALDGSMHVATCLWGTDPSALAKLVHGDETTLASPCKDDSGIQRSAARNDAQYTTVFDVVIAADCIYDPDSHLVLLQTCACTLRSGGVVLMSFSLHGNTDEVKVFSFLPKARRCGFQVEALQPEAMQNMAAAIRSRQCASADRSVVYCYRLTASPDTSSHTASFVADCNGALGGVDQAAIEHEAEQDRKLARESSAVLSKPPPAEDAVVLSVTRRVDGPSVEVRESAGQRGRGVFATEPIERGMLIEIAPCIVVPHVQYNLHVQHSIFEEYLFRCRNTGDYLLALGIGSLFNHSEHPNVDYKVHGAERRIEYRSCKAIESGEELCIYYGDTLWFDDSQQ